MAATPQEILPVATLPDRCFPRHLENCQTYQGGYFSLPGRRLYWQIQNGDVDENAAAAGFAFFTEASGVLTPVFWAFEAREYQAPALMQIGFPSVPVIAVAGAYAGNGHFNADALFRWTEGPHPLVPIENRTWRYTLNSRLPADLAIRKGVGFEYFGSRIVASSSVWRSQDGDCCPTGGSARLYFDIEEDRLVLADIEIHPPQDTPG